MSWAPHTVPFGGTAAIKGRLEGGTPGDKISLQQQRGDTPWRTVSTKPIDEYRRVTFKRHDLRRSSAFRLAYTDEVAGVTKVSDGERVRVKSKLAISVNPRHAYVGRSITVRGRLLPVVEGRKVVIQQKTGGAWRTVRRAAVGPKGYYKGSFEANAHGHRKVRAVFRGDADSVKARENSPLTVYRRDLATWYGPGLYGNRTACGQTLTTETLGVAHRSLPCGTQVDLLYQGRTVSVRVIDRGPFTSARWDLTKKTADRLGFRGKEQVGVTH
jgi:rare lipoprotein A (peptidoglycan hydrolase)